jgi:hypothetical protein
MGFENDMCSTVVLHAFYIFLLRGGFTLLILYLAVLYVSGGDNFFLFSLQHLPNYIIAPSQLTHRNSVNSLNQCCGSGFSESGSGSGADAGSKVLMAKKLQKNTAEHFFFLFGSKITIYLALGHLKGYPSYRRILQLSKEIIQHFKK